MVRPPVLNSDDRKALSLLYRKTHKLGNGHFQAPVLWKGSSRPYNNLQQAVESWRQLELRLDRDPAKREAYEKVVQGWIDSGYMQRLSKEAALESNAFYLLHFPVYREDKQSTRVRIVMNGKSEYKGTSLNDCVLKGPKVINELVNVLLRFRRYRVAVSGDVREMFLQVHLAAEDAKFHRIVFSFRREGDTCILEARVHLFGNRGSPTIVIFVIKWAATLFQTTHPLGAETILDSSLVDDCMDSVKTEDDARQLVKELKEIFAYCGMKIHKWVCSHEGVVPGPREKVLVRDPNLESDFPGGKALGISYDPIKDEFRFKEKLQPEGEVWNRRKTLAFYMSLYDPLGFILPVLMVARMLFQETWYAEPTWENTLSKELQDKWNSWTSQLAGLPVLAFPRWLHLEELDSAVERRGLHVFCDSSKAALGACAYLVTSKQSVLVFAKGKIIKRKGSSIPSCELESGRLAVGVGKKVAQALGMEESQVWYHCDAVPVLGWIKAPPRSLPYHVARIAGYIRENTDPSHWRHVPTKLNPADLISRGTSVRQLAKSKLWLEGPPYLLNLQWPPEKVQPTEVIELPAEEALTRLIGIYHAREAEALGEVAEAPLCHVGNLQRGIRILRHVCAFFEGISAKTKKALPNLEDPIHVWIRMDQFFHFPTETAEMQAGLKSGNPLFQGYNVSWEHGVIYIGGRTKFPSVPLLHKESHLAKLWLLYLHNQVLRHAGGEMTLKAESRKHFWLFKGSKVFKLLTRSCVHCRRQNPREQSQYMAPLPAFRQDTSSHLGFAHCAVDFGGPWLVKVNTEPTPGKRSAGTAYGKRYLLLICCSVYRAVRCEITDGKSTLAVLMALQRFASRNRIPSHIHSDNAKEFIACAKSLSDMEYQNNIAYPLSPEWNKVTWTYCHPRSPHTNGVVESLIGVTKRAMAHALHGAPLTDDVLRTVAAYAEGVVNSRPISTVSADPADPEPLTPEMFMGGRLTDTRHLGLPITGGVTRNKQLREQWRMNMQIQGKFRDRFIKELMPELNKRSKWWDLVPGVQKDDIVVVLSCPPNDLGLWPLGRVIEPRRGRDGVIRGAKVLVNGSEYDRHISQLVPLL